MEKEERMNDILMNQIQAKLAILDVNSEGKKVAILDVNTEGRKK